MVLVRHNLLFWSVLAKILWNLVKVLFVDFNSIKHSKIEAYESMNALVSAQYGVCDYVPKILYVVPELSVYQQTYRLVELFPSECAWFQATK